MAVAGVVWAGSAHGQLTGQLGILDLEANGGINPATGVAWQDGDTYRLVFFTSTTRDATSSDIADYNSFVQNAANGSSLNLASATWKAIASTATANAIDNTSTAPTEADYGVSVFLVDGTTLVATDYRDLWASNAGGFTPVALDNAIEKNENGVFGSNVQVYTGTKSDQGGVKEGNGLGGASGDPVFYGNNQFKDSRHTKQGSSANTVLRSFYGISEPLQVTAPPAPFRLTITSVGIGLFDFEWPNRAGKWYSLVSSADLTPDPSTWPVYDDGNGPYEYIPYSGTATRTMSDLGGNGSKHFFAVIEQDALPAVTALSENFDGADPGWTTGPNAGDSGNTLWELGDPYDGAPFGPGDPVSFYNCYGTNLLDNYGTDSDIWLRTPTIDLTDAVVARLTFQHFRDLEVGSDFDEIRVLDAGNVQLGASLATPLEGTFGTWQEVTLDLPPEALGNIVKIEFHFTSDAQDAVLQNSGFELPVIAVDEDVAFDGKNPTSPGWERGYYGDFAAATPVAWVSTTEEISGIWRSVDATGSGFTGGPIEGGNTGYAYTFEDRDAGLSQRLPIVLAPSTDYDLSVQVGNAMWNTPEALDYRIELLAGGGILASLSGTAPGNDSWELKTLPTINPGVGHPLEGQQLEIRLVAENVPIGAELEFYEVDFDDVQFSVTPAGPSSGLRAGWYLDNVEVIKNDP